MLFAFGQYRFTLQAKTPIGFFDGDAGTTLRGAFGAALRQIVCIDRRQECPQCPLKEQCVFPLVFVFSPIRAPDSGPFLLIGRLGNYFPYVIVPFKELGQHGIGMDRGKFSLARLRASSGGWSKVA
jgi:hypothetical protein